MIAVLLFAIVKFASDDKFLAGWGAYFTALATFALVVGALVAARTAIQELGEKRNLERARWLTDLYRSHYEEEKFKSIRAKIDYNDLDDVRAIIKKDLQSRGGAGQNAVPETSWTDKEKLLLDELTDYFNFFELIGYLCKLEVISSEDVNALFQYYLNQLAKVDSDCLIRNYLKEVDFEYVFTHLGVECNVKSPA
jgi:hypothetical protein